MEGSWGLLVQLSKIEAGRMAADLRRAARARAAGDPSEHEPIPVRPDSRPLAKSATRAE